jgi:hypothetical protein
MNQIPQQNLGGAISIKPVNNLDEARSDKGSGKNFGRKAALSAL